MAKIVVLEDKGNHVLPVTVTDAVRANDDSANLTELLDLLRSDIGAIAKLIGEDADGNVFVRRKEDGSARALYSFGAISTKGNSNDTSGGGGGADLSAVWQSLTTNIDSFADLKINTNHIPTLTSAKIGDFASAVAALVPTNISQLVNDAGFITASAIANKADKATTLAGYGITDAMRYLGTVDANSVKASGYAYVTSNGAGGNGGLIAFGGTSYQTQLYADYLGGNLYWRVNANGTYTSWAKIATKGTTLEHYGITDGVKMSGAVKLCDATSASAISCAIGYGAKADGYASFAVGYSANAKNTRSVVLGSYATASHDDVRNFSYGGNTGMAKQIVMGYLPATDTQNIFVLGNGDSDSNRKNIFTISPNGDIYASGNLSLLGSIVADISANHLTASSVNLAECIVCNNADGIIQLFGDKIVANSPIEAKSTFKIGNATLYYDPATDSIVCDKNIVAIGAISTKG